MESSTHGREPLGSEEMSGAGQPHGGGQRRQITVLFSDLVDSTPLAGRLDPGLGEVNAALHPRLGATLQVRIGGHTGVVVTGAIETGSRPEEFAMAGETPHVAARLQTVAEPGSVVISDVTETLLHGYFETEALGERALAGVVRPVHVFRVLRPSGVEDRLGSTARQRLTPLVSDDMHGALQRRREFSGVLHPFAIAARGCANLLEGR